jgi:DNA-binding SARP family transcriptional activator
MDERRRPRPRVRPGGVDRVELALMGTFRLSVDGRAVDLPGGAQRILALLGLHGRMSRSRLAGTMWPDATEARALASLRTGLWRVSQLAPALIVAAGDSLDVDPRTSVDVREFVAAAVAALHGGPIDLASRPVGASEQDLLIGWDDPWLTHERERLHQLRLHLLERQAAQLTEEGRFGLAIDTALVAVRADVLRESAHRALIRAHLAEGNIGEARRAYSACTRLLERELGVPPSRETTALVDGRNPGAAPEDSSRC